MEEVLGRWNSLAITSEEEDVLGVDDNLLVRGREVRSFTLMGKVLTKRPFNREAFKRTMGNLWRVEDGGLTIKSVDRDLFLFSFRSAKEGRRILDTEPWHFENALVVLKEIKEGDRIVWDNWTFTKFWIQIFNLPLCGMIKDIGEVIGRGFGKCLEVTSDPLGRCIGSYMRIRVLIDISKPLRRGAKVRLGKDGDVVWVDVRYERLPDFCFICGCLGHVLRDCLTENLADSTGNQAYGVWLKASSFLKSGFGAELSKGGSTRNGRPATAMLEGRRHETTAVTSNKKISNLPDSRKELESGSRVERSQDGVSAENSPLDTSSMSGGKSGAIKFLDLTKQAVEVTKGMNTGEVGLRDGSELPLGPITNFVATQTESLSPSSLSNQISVGNKEGLVFSTGSAGDGKENRLGSVKRKARLIKKNVSGVIRESSGGDKGKRKIGVQDEVLEAPKGKRTFSEGADAGNVDVSAVVAEQPRRQP